ncbi:MAG: sulfatase [Terrimicrobiaceae bacterium]
MFHQSILISMSITGALGMSSFLIASDEVSAPAHTPVQEDGTDSDRRPNVLFLAVDDLRPAIAAAGDPLAITPNLDRLVQSGVMFANAYCQQAVCHPSRASLLTGVRPDTSGIYDLVTPIRDKLPDVVTLPQLFRQSGYHVVGRGKIFHGKLDDPASWDSAPSEGRTLKGKLYALPENRQPETPIEEGKPRTRGPAYERADVADNTYPDGILADEAVELLKTLSKNRQPFFLAVGFLKPHLPFCAPAKYWDLYDREKLWPPPTRCIPPGVPEWTSQPGWELRNAYQIPNGQGEPLYEDFEKTLRHGYYACVSYVDAQIGRVLDALEAEGLDESTVVVLWGDHGYHVGDMGTWCKHTNYEVAVHAPLMMRAPGYRGGQVVKRPVEFLDIYPTLAELCHLKVPEHLEGQSLVPLLQDPNSTATSGLAFSQYPRGNKEKPLMGYSVRKEQWRYTEWIRTDAGQVVFRELYDLEGDPHVTRNLAGDPALKPIVEQLSKLLNRAGAGVIRARAGHSPD